MKSVYYIFVLFLFSLASITGVAKTKHGNQTQEVLDALKQNQQQLTDDILRMNGKSVDDDDRVKTIRSSKTEREEADTSTEADSGFDLLDRIVKEDSEELDKSTKAQSDVLDAFFGEDTTNELGSAGDTSADSGPFEGYGELAKATADEPILVNTEVNGTKQDALMTLNGDGSATLSTNSGSETVPAAETSKMQLKDPSGNSIPPPYLPEQITAVMGAGGTFQLSPKHS